MYFVYAIKSETRNYIYVGMTNDLNRRFNQHQNGENKGTKAYRPFTLIYVEEFSSRVDARNKEKILKSGYGKEFLKKLINISDS